MVRDRGGGRMVQRLNGREVRLEKLEKLKVYLEGLAEYLSWHDESDAAQILQGFMDDVWPPQKEE